MPEQPAIANCFDLAPEFNALLGETLNGVVHKDEGRDDAHDSLFQSSGASLRSAGSPLVDEEIVSGIALQRTRYFLSLTPAPPPFSGMNSTPAASRALRIAARLEGMACRAAPSKFWMVRRLTPLATLSPAWLIPKSPRAARH